MIAVDTNILVYAHRSDSVWHEPALGAVRALAEGNARWALPWPCVHEFIAIVTNARIFVPPTPLERALEQVDAWLASPSVVQLSEEQGYWPVLRQTARSGKVDGPRIHDARVAALCKQHGVRELWSADRDFDRFAELRVRNPLVK